jgi:hypothetical protein
LKLQDEVAIADVETAQAGAHDAVLGWAQTPNVDGGDWMS